MKKVVKIELIYEDKTENSDRSVIITVQDGNHLKTANVVACHESYEQYGADREVLGFTQSIAQGLNGWLHYGTGYLGH